LTIEIFSSEKTELHLNNKLMKERFEKIAFFEHYRIKLINFIFVSDRTIIILNSKFLRHYYPTDIITFDYCKSIYLEGDIYISVDTILKNSKKFNNSFKSELFRVMIHGMLHLMKYKDKNERQKKEMRLKENYYLKLFLKDLF
jgi:probable rRNA maturation factor